MDATVDPRLERTIVELHASDGVPLRGYRTLGPGKPKAAVVLVHGYAEHSERYLPTITALAASRFAVYSVDLRGHGRSGGARVDIQRFDQFVDDLALVVALARGERSGQPCYLLAHSMGGLIALRLALRSPEPIDGLALTAPALKAVSEPSRVEERLLRVIARVAPKARVVPGIRNALSSDPAVEAKTRLDPLHDNGKMRARFAVAFLDAGRDTRRRSGSLNVPVMIQHGSDDRLIEPDGSTELYRRIGVRTGVDNSLITWPGLQHELLNEPDGDQVLGVIVAWFNGHYVAWRKTHE